MTNAKFGRWLRVEVTSRAALSNRAFFDDGPLHSAVINLDNVTKVEPFKEGSVVSFTDLTEVVVADDFEVLSVALMASEMPVWAS